MQTLHPWDTPSGLLTEFVKLMYSKLREGQKKHGDEWKNMTQIALMRRLHEEIAEALLHDNPYEWADVANFAMFLSYRRSVRDFVKGETMSSKVMGECEECGGWFYLTPKRRNVPKHTSSEGFRDGHTAFPITHTCPGGGEKASRARIWDEKGKLKDVKVPK